ncbi:MAG: hypothetical protein ACRELF_23660, partial [Gemmataceae bacterium]
MKRLPLSIASLCLLLSAAPGHALGPKDVYLLVNKNVPESRQIAEHYCAKRGVPRDHILAFDLPTTEDISRDAFNKRLAAPLRKQLADRRDKAKVLLSIFGVPLRVGGNQPSAEEKIELDKVRKELN